MGVRSPNLHDARRVVHRLAHWAQALPEGGVHEVEPNLYVCAPLILPPFGSRLRRELNRRVLLPLLRHAVRGLRFDPAVIWTFLPTDTAVSLVRLLKGPRTVVVYYCIADFAELTPHPKDILWSERALVAMSDVVFAQGPRLAERCARDGKQVEVVPFGVDFDLFANGNGHRNGSSAQGGQGSAAELMAGLPRPIIGYVGGIHNVFDVEMLAEMAEARPEWSWVLVGPQQTSTRALKRIPNVYLSGPRPHEELPDFIRRFDVGIVPYLSNGYTSTVIPTKINEYLAMGKPVVSTDLPEVRHLNGKHGVVITCPNRSEEFIASIESALGNGGGEAEAARRRAVASANDWGARSERMSQTIERVLRKKGRLV
jgi:glycosyltransferase involved in cell wall biosynthesis